MAQRIKQLPLLVANQIAAGEVIERPASVIKELFENSLDAGATSIQIKSRSGGANYIQLKDNGVGIHKDDLELALSRHATSKLQDSSSLSRIATLGFRGEALASIASVAKVKLASHFIDSEYGYQISFDPSIDALSDLDKVSQTVGTTVTVEELFFTVPARRHFLRSPRTEKIHSEECIKRLSLSVPQVAIRYFDEDKLQLNLPCHASLQDRVSAIMGKAFIASATHITNQATGLKLTAWLGSSDQTRSQSDKQYIFINGRNVRDKLLAHALRSSFGDTILPGRYPVYAVFLELDPDMVDVNVHPTKHEVRFRQMRLLHDFMTSSLQGLTTVENSAAVMPEFITPAQISVAPYVGSESSSYSEQKSTRFFEARSTHYEPLPEVISFANQWLFGKDKQGLWFIHLHAAMAQQTIEAFSADFLTKKLIVAPKLYPETISLLVKQIEAIDLHQSLLAQLGFDISILGNQQMVVRSLPAVLKFADTKALFSCIADHFKNTSVVSSASIGCAVACLSAPESVAEISAVDKKSLYERCREMENDYSCPHRHVAFKRFTAKELESLLESCP